MITLEMFTKDFYILAFDRTPDRETDEEDISLPRHGNVHIEAFFKNHSPNLQHVFCMLNTAEIFKLIIL